MSRAGAQQRCALSGQVIARFGRAKKSDAASDSRRWDRGREFGQIERCHQRRNPLDNVPPEVPRDDRRQDHCAGGAPQARDRMALAGREAVDPPGLGSRLVVVGIGGIRLMTGATAARSSLRNLAIEIGLICFGGRLGDNACRQGDAALARPGQSFRGRIATAMVPALFGRRATASVMLAWERRVARLRDARRHRNADGRDKIRAEHRGHRQTAAQQRFRSMPTPAAHACQTRAEN
jgi:hypothetical protein